MADHVTANLAVLRHMALNLLNREMLVKAGFKAKRLKVGWYKLTCSKYTLDRAKSTAIALARGSSYSPGCITKQNAPDWFETMVAPAAPWACTR
jgi:hypothetical protein